MAKALRVPHLRALGWYLKLTAQTLKASGVNWEGFWARLPAPGDPRLAVSGCVGSVSVQLGAGYWTSVVTVGVGHEGVDVKLLRHSAAGVWKERRVYQR